MIRSSTHDSNIEEPYDWRDRLARQYAAEGRHLRRSQSDRVVYELYRLRLALQGGTNALQLDHCDRDLREALTIRDSAASLRARIEAYVLTGMPAEEIAARVAVPCQVVARFEAAFFDVRGHLGDPSYLLQEVINPFRRVQPDRLFPDYVWKLVALAGVDPLERLLAAEEIVSSGDVAAVFLQDARLLLASRIAHLAARAGEKDSGNVAALAKLIENLRKIDVGKPDELAERIRELFESFPLEGGGPSKKNSSPKAIKKYEESAAELHYEETMQVAMGEDLPYGDALRRIEFPEPEQEDAGSRKRRGGSRKRRIEPPPSPSSRKRQAAVRQGEIRENEAPQEPTDGARRPEDVPNTAAASGVDGAGQPEGEPNGAERGRRGEPDKTANQSTGGGNEADRAAEEQCRRYRRLLSMYEADVLSIPERLNRKRFRAKLDFGARFAHWAEPAFQERFKRFALNEKLPDLLQSRISKYEKKKSHPE